MKIWKTIKGMKSTRAFWVSNPQKPMGPLRQSLPQTAPMGLFQRNSRA
jgi:hypothetical protein